MLINTKFFGEVDVLESDIIHFPEGIPGFPFEKSFVIMYDAEQQEPGAGVMLYLQSAQTQSLAFIMLMMTQILPDYSPESAALSALPDFLRADAPQYGVYNLVSIPEGDVRGMTVNLAAPIIIEHSLKRGAQVLLDENAFPIRHEVFEQLKEAVK
jgi:flagellar assembly factor FliW